MNQRVIYAGAEQYWSIEEERWNYSESDGTTLIYNKDFFKLKILIIIYKKKRI